MPKQVKKNPTEVVETIAATTAAPVVVEKAVKAPKAKKEPKVEVKVETVVAPASAAVVEEAVAAVSAVEDIEAAIAAKSAEFSSKLNQLGALVASLKSEYKSMERQWTKDLKAAQKASKKGKRKTGNRQPSGLLSPPESPMSLLSSWISPLAPRWPALMLPETSMSTSEPITSRTRRTVVRLTLMPSSSPS